MTRPAPTTPDFTTGVLNQQVSFVLAEQEVAKPRHRGHRQDIANAEKALANDLSHHHGHRHLRLGRRRRLRPQSLTTSARSRTPWSRASPTSSPSGPTSPTELSTDEALQKAFDDVRRHVQEPGLRQRHPGARRSGPDPGPDHRGRRPAARLRLRRRAGQGQRPVGPAGPGRRLRHAGQVQLRRHRRRGANGGDLGCNPIGSYAQQQPEIDDAITNQPLGKPGEPVKTNFGYAIVLVRSRGDLTFEEAKPQLKAAVPTQARTAFQDWFISAAKAATVTVDPQYGSWDAETGTVVPPEGATTSTTAADRSTRRPPDCRPTSSTASPARPPPPRP